ncbi:hypothetical protein D3C85_1349070 [compost metagenome]
MIGHCHRVVAGVVVARSARGLRDHSNAMFAWLGRARRGIDQVEFIVACRQATQTHPVRHDPRARLASFPALANASASADRTKWLCRRALVHGDRVPCSAALQAILEDRGSGDITPICRRPRNPRIACLKLEILGDRRNSHRRHPAVRNGGRLIDDSRGVRVGSTRASVDQQQFVFELAGIHGHPVHPVMA